MKILNFSFKTFNVLLKILMFSLKRLHFTEITDIFIENTDILLKLLIFFMKTLKIS